MEEAFRPIMQLMALEHHKGGIHYKTLFEIGGCAVYEGRKFDGKVCPKPEPKSPKEKKPKDPKVTAGALTHGVRAQQLPRPRTTKVKLPACRAPYARRPTTRHAPTAGLCAAHRGASQPGGPREV